MNVTIDRIHQVLGNLVLTYNPHETHVDDSDLWMEILVSAAFEVRSMYHRTKGKIPGQLVFSRDIILPINHISDWKYIRQYKQAQILKGVIHKNCTRTEHDYKVGYQVTIGRKIVFKNVTPFKVPYEIVQTWENVSATLRTGAVTTIANIRRIEPYKNNIEEGNVFINTKNEHKYITNIYTCKK